MRIGGDKISPLIPYGEADAIVAMEAMEALRYIEYLEDDGVVITNSRVINPPIEVATLSKEKRSDFLEFKAIIEKIEVVTKNIAPIDAIGLAKEAGNPLTENAVFIGALAALETLPLSVDDMKKGLSKVVPEKALEVNLKAFELGHKAAYDGLCELVACRVK